MLCCYRHTACLVLLRPGTIVLPLEQNTKLVINDLGRIDARIKKTLALASKGNKIDPPHLNASAVKKLNA